MALFNGIDLLTAVYTATSIVFVYLCFTYYHRVKLHVKIWLATRNMPGPPKAHWWYGHTPLMTCDEKFLLWLRSFWKYGKLITFHLGRDPMVMALHPDTAKVFLSRIDSKDGLVTTLGKDFIGDGLASTKGEKWKRNRKLLTPAFHLNTLRGYVPIMQCCILEHLATWREQAANQTSVNVSNNINHMTMECLLSCAFGQNALSKNQRILWRESAEEIATLWMSRMTYLPYQYDWLYKFTKNGQRHTELIEIVNTLSRLMIANSHKSMAMGTDDKKTLSFVDIILRAKDDEGKGLSEREMLDEINTFTFAGHHTLASAIPYCLHYLARYPECQERCRKEISDVMGERRNVTWEDLSQMAYLTMFIKESLRIAGPFNFTHRTLEQDVEVEGYTIPKGCTVGVMIETVHYHPEVWTSPDVFDPLRFSPENADKRHPYAFLEFAAGIRNCIGQNFAMTEIRIMLVSVLQQFRLRLDEDKPLVMMFPFMRFTRDGTWLEMEALT